MQSWSAWASSSPSGTLLTQRYATSMHPGRAARATSCQTSRNRSFSVRSTSESASEQRRVIRQELSAPLVADLESWMREQRAKLSGGNDLAKAMDYMLKRWTAFTRFLDDGRICLSNNAAERALRGTSVARNSTWKKVVTIRRLRSRRTARRRHVQHHRHGHDERRG